MAKETKLETNKFDLDLDLNFDFDPESTIRSKVTKEASDKNSRKPIQETFSGTISGAKSRLSEPGFLSKMTKKALPEQYGEIFDALDKGTGSLSSIYEETLRELKPQLIRLNKSVDKIIPDEQKFLKTITSKIKASLGEDTSTSYRNNNEQFKEQSIQNSLNSVFEQQRNFDIEIQARKQAEDKIKESVDATRFSRTHDLLQSINDNTIRLSSYTERVTQAYQRKSLELSYRSYFVQSELLQEYRKNSEVRKLQNDSIVKNTALPEYVKVNDAEKFKDLARTKFFSSIQNSLFGNKGVLENALNNLKTQTGDFVTGLKSGLENAINGADTIQGIKEQNDLLKEMDAEPISKYGMLGSALGSSITDAVGGFIGKKVRGKIKDTSTVGKFGYKAADFINNIGPNISNLRNSNFITENEFGSGSKSVLANLANFGLDLFNTKGPNLNIGKNNILSDLNSATSFDKRSYITITDIIPGYLSRIHRELLALRTGNPNAEQTIFDIKSNKFVTASKMSQDIRQSLSSGIKDSAYDYYLDKETNGLLKGTNVSKDQINKVKSFLSDISTRNMAYTPESIKNSDLFKSLDPSTAKIVSDMLDSNISKSGTKEKGQYDFTKSILKIKNATPDVKRQIQEYYDLGYGEILESQGIVVSDKFGNKTINLEKYKSIVKDQSIFGINDSEESPSVINKGRRFRSRNNASSTPVQSRVVNRGLGKDSISEIISQLDSSSKEQNGILLTIKEDTSALVNSIGKVSSSGSNNPSESTGSQSNRRTGNTYKDILLNFISDGIDTASKIGKDLYSGFSNIKDKGDAKIVKPVGDFVAKLYKDNKEDTISLFRKIFSSATNLAIGAMDFSKNLINNTIPAKFKELTSYVLKIKDDILDFLEGPIDIYIKGIKTPVIRANLMKIGYYFDQATGEVIKSIKDIKGPVIDKLGNVVLTIEDIKEGLFNIDGKEVTTRLSNFGKILAQYGSEGLSRLKNFGGNLFNAISNNKIGESFRGMFKSSSSIGDEKSYSVLVEIRDILKVIARVNVRNSDDFGSSGVRYSEDNVLDTFLKKGKETLNKRKQKRVDESSFNDRDKDGKRDGNYEERLNKFKENRNKNRTQEQPKAEARYKSDNIIDTIFSKAKGLMEFLSNGVSGIFGTVSSLIGGIGGLSGVLGKAASVAGSVIKSPITAISSLFAATKGASALGSLGAMASAAKNVVMAGALATTGTGSAILGIAGSAMAALGAILTSPVALGVIAASSAAYGVYKGYKYFTRDKLNEFEEIRIKQYGLTNSELDKDYNHKILELENYLIDDSVIGYRDGHAYLLPRKFDTVKVLSIFSIDPKDNESINNFQRWFNGRFKPFFLTHVTGLYSVNPKVKLSDVSNIDVNEKIRYLELVSFESGPYSELTSPFKGYVTLTNNKESVSKDIKYLLDKLTKDRLKSNKDNTYSKDLSKKVINNTISDKGMVAKEIPISNNPVRNTNKQPPINLNVSEDGGVQGKINIPSYYKPSQSVQVTEAIGAINRGDNAGQFINLANGVKLDGINPTMMEHLKGMIQEYGELTGKAVTITSGSRSRQDQERLFKQNPNKAAKPGNSLHEFGLAVDLDSSALNEMEKLGLMRKYGFTRPVGGEPWHIEAAGIQANIKGAKENASLADQLIAASINKGGGGVGTISNSPLGKRDTQYALKLMDIKPNIVDPSKDKDESNTVIAGMDKSNKFSNTTVVTRNGGYSGSVNNVSRENSYISGGIGSDQEAKPLPRNKEEVKERIADAAKKANADPNTMQAFAAVESGLDPNASSGNAKGPYQFMPATWKEQVNKHGSRFGVDSSSSPTDVEDSTYMAKMYMDSNSRTISPVKPDVNLTDIYLSHFAGPNGAKKLLTVLKSNPGELAHKVLPKAAEGNYNLFYKNKKPLTVSEFYNNLTALIQNKSYAFGITPPSIGAVKETAIREQAANDSEGSYSDNGLSGSLVGTETQQVSAKQVTPPAKDNRSSSIFSSPELPTGMSPTSMKDNNGILNIDKGLSNVTDVLNRSLVVQTQILSKITELTDYTKSNNGNPISKEGGVQKVDTRNGMNIANREIKSAVDLDRKVS